MKKERTLNKIEVICLFCVMLLLAYLMQGFWQNGQKKTPATLHSLTNGWYQMVDGERIELTLPCTVTADENGLVMLSNTSLTRAYRGSILSVRGIQYDVDVWVGRQCLYRNEVHQFEKNRQMKGKLWADASLPDTVGKYPVSLVLRAKPGQQLYVQAPFIGSASAVTVKHLQDAAFSILVIVIMLLFGIVAFVVFLYTRHFHITERRFLDVALFMAVCGTWCLLDSGLYQMYGRHSDAGAVVSFYAFMLMSVPILRFVEDTVSEQAKRIPRIWILLLYLNAILQGVINILWKIPFIRMLPVTHILLIVGVASMVVLLVQEYRKHHHAVLTACLRAFCTLGFCGVAALVLYWAFSIYWYDTVFQFGILLFITILFWHLLCKIAQDIRFRMEQKVYEKISEEDRMTGLKNRKAFDQYLEQIQSAEIEFENALLLFIDITGLKQINDTRGLNRGDETVIRVARGIQSAAAGELEKAVECFRIDGTEFAVVVLDPKKQPEIWEETIKRELERAGSQIRFNLGYSYLKRYDGSFNTISDWKNKADNMLHGR